MRLIRNTLVVYLSVLNLAVANPLPDMDELGEGYDAQSAEEVEAARQHIESEFADARAPEDMTSTEVDAILKLYDHLDPQRWVPSDLLRTTVLYFHPNKSKFKNQNYISIVDFKPRSDRYRFFLIDMKTGAVERYRTTHGVGSDTNDDGFAESYGNVVNSGKSSLGFARTAEVYWGKFKRSVRLDGLSSTNSRIRQRAIVFHGWDGVREAPVKQGRSWGCITLDWKIKDAVLDKIKEGSLMYSGVSK